MKWLGSFCTYDSLLKSQPPDENNTFTLLTYSKLSVASLKYVYAMSLKLKAKLWVVHVFDFYTLSRTKLAGWVIDLEWKFRMGVHGLLNIIISEMKIWFSILCSWLTLGSDILFVLVFYPFIVLSKYLNLFLKELFSTVFRPFYESVGWITTIFFSIKKFQKKLRFFLFAILYLSIISTSCLNTHLNTNESIKDEESAKN